MKIPKNQCAKDNFLPYEDERPCERGAFDRFSVKVNCCCPQHEDTNGKSVGLKPQTGLSFF